MLGISISMVKQISKRKHALNTQLTNNKVTKMAMPPRRLAYSQYVKLATIYFFPFQWFPIQNISGHLY